MSIKITHPTPADVEAVGLQFVGGVAEVESISDEAATILREHGYTVDAAKEPAKRAPKKAADPKTGETAKEPANDPEAAD